MKKSKAYRSIKVKNVRLEQVLEGREGARVVVGLDVGKKEVM